MIVEKLSLPGPLLLKPEKHPDERGFFTRTFCREQLAEHGVTFDILQTSLSFNQSSRTLRGLHYQQTPGSEQKLVSCLQGAIYDVVLDLRPESSHFRSWTAVQLDARNLFSLYIPAGFAHGFLTLEEVSLVHYAMDTPHQPELARGVRWNDPAFAISWPEAPARIHPRDAAYPDFVCAS